MKNKNTWKQRPLVLLGWIVVLGIYLIVSEWDYQYQVGGVL